MAQFGSLFCKVNPFFFAQCQIRTIVRFCELIVFLALIFRLESEVTPPNHLKETATGEMQYLMTLVQNTAVSILFVFCWKIEGD